VTVRHLLQRHAHKARRSRPSWWRRHLVVSAVLALLLVAGAAAAPSLVPALTRPGTDSVAARLAEWGRTHGFSSAIDGAERLRYKLNPPKTGGIPKEGLPTGATAVPLPSRQAAMVRSLPVPPRVSPLVKNPLPGEGTWHLAATVGGSPVIATAFLRPDATHTSYVSALVWMNPQRLRFSLHPGTVDPGGSNWKQPTTIPPRLRLGVLAAFNSGFRLYASRGGFYADGHSVGKLRVGAASLVIDSSGRATVGQWGRDVRPGRNIAAVRQNLDLIVDSGRPVAGLGRNTQNRWGATLGNAYYVWRSSIGRRPDGSLVYVAGNSLSAETLAGLLVRAGCVRAMELDINPEWTSYVLFSGNGKSAAPVPHKLLPDMQQPADRYFHPVSRDFFVVSASAGGRQ
jgi:hypothetical protein